MTFSLMPLDVTLCPLLLHGVEHQRVYGLAQPVEAAHGCRQGGHAQQRGGRDGEDKRAPYLARALCRLHVLLLEFSHDRLEHAVGVGLYRSGQAGDVRVGEEVGYFDFHAILLPCSARRAASPCRGGAVF